MTDSERFQLRTALCIALHRLPHDDSTAAERAAKRMIAWEKAHRRRRCIATPTTLLRKTK
jgi:hypothetical protein